MSNTPEMSIYESTFAPSDKTDAILVVDGKKLHVNKALLSYHSDYFKTLFNSDFAEKSMSEIPIEDVKFKEFATLLSLIQDNPIKPTGLNAEKLLQLADQFLIPAAKRHMELVIGCSNINRASKLKLAGKYNLEILLDDTVKTFETAKDYRDMNNWIDSVSEHVRAKLLGRLLNLVDFGYIKLE